MLRVFAFCVAGLMVIASLAAGQVEDLMGLYEGEFKGGPWEGKPLKVQMVARGHGRFEAVFSFEASAVRVSVHGRREEDRQDANFAGAVDLGAAAGGSYEITAQLANGAFIGQFSSATSKIPFETSRVVRMSPTFGKQPPAGAILLFDGSNLDAWELRPPKWRLKEEASMEVCLNSLATKEEFGDCEIHVEFRTPFKATSSGQSRGNSGVYVAGRYEIQVVDSFGIEPAHDLCGGIYEFAAPIADVCAPPLQWQTYDITFTAPRFDTAGNKTANARITVLHNGVVIHDDLELSDRTPGGVGGEEEPRGPLLLQNHDNKVRYRNIWLVPHS